MFYCTKCDYKTTDGSNYKRHCSRKTPCGAAQNVSPITQNVSPITQNVSPITQNVSPITQNVSLGYTITDNGLVECDGCHKQMLRRNVQRHLQTCDGIPENTCEFCQKQFTTRQAKYKHRKNCQQKMVPVNIQIINNNTFVNCHFGKTESLEHFKDIVSYDERFSKMHENIYASVGCSFFNKNHPENQTVRKTNRKSNTIEFRMGDDWLHQDTTTSIPKILKRVSDLIAPYWRPNDKDYKYLKKKYPTETTLSGLLFCKWIDTYTSHGSKTVISDILYQFTKQGPLEEERILSQIMDPPEINKNSPNWQAFVDAVNSEYTQDAASCVHRDMFVKHYKPSTMERLKDMSLEHNVENFYCFRDGEDMFDDIKNRMYPTK